MLNKVSGIILRKINPYYICVLSKEHGKLQLQTQSNFYLSTGSSFNGWIMKKKTSFSLTKITNHLPPQVETICDLTWTHHLLELFYFFLPENQPADRELDFLHTYLKTPCACKNSQKILLQELALSHFLVQTGFYEHPILHQHAQIFEEVIDPVGNHGVPSHQDSSQKDFLRKIILRCLQEHPSFDKFKTMSFLYKACQ